MEKHQMEGKKISQQSNWRETVVYLGCNIWAQQHQVTMLSNFKDILFVSVGIWGKFVILCWFCAF